MQYKHAVWSVQCVIWSVHVQIQGHLQVQVQFVMYTVHRHCKCFLAIKMSALKKCPRNCAKALKVSGVGSVLQNGTHWQLIKNLQTWCYFCGMRLIKTKHFPVIFREKNKLTYILNPKKMLSDWRVNLLIL